MPTAVSYIAAPILKIDGQAASDALMEDILQISVEESLHLPGMFTLVIKNDYFPGREDDSPWKHENLFEIGKTIEIGFISSATESSEFDDADQGNVLKGEVTAIETHFTSDSQAPIIVRGYDVSHRLHRGRHNRSFQNKTDTDIVKQIAGEVGIPTGTVDNTQGPYGYGDISGSNGYIFQENQTNMEFLRERAARHGFELFVQDGKLNFRKPQKGDTVELTWLTDLHSFRVRVTSAEQVNSVEVRGWDYNRKEAISETATQANKVFTTTDRGTGSSTSSSFQGKPSTPKLIVVDQPVSQSQEAKTIAEALCNELGGEFVYADARSEGNPGIRPGKLISLANMGKYSGKYYITETRHLFHERVYTTEFSIRGLRGGNLLQTLSSSAQLQPGQTCMIGIVADNNDPKGWGRVRVKFPTLTEEHMSNWARVVSVGAGGKRGVEWLPEINDEVLVAFEHGDIHRPYVLGGVWNGKDATPDAIADTVVDGKVNLRTLKTTEQGHRLQFVEKTKGSNKKGIYLDSANLQGHHLHLNDEDEKIELKTKKEHVLNLDDKNKKIELTSKGEIDITSSGNITIQDKDKKTIKVDGGTISVQGSSKIELKVGGSSITISQSSIVLKSGSSKLELGAASAKLSGVATEMSGSATAKVSGATSVQVSGLSIKLG